MTSAHLRALRYAGTLRVKGHTLPEDILAAEWKAVDAAKERAARALAAQVRPLLTDAALAAATDLSFRVDLLSATLARTLPAAILDALRAGFASGLVRIDARLPFDAERAVVRETVARLVALADSVPATLASRVETAIRDGLAQGLTSDEVSARLRTVVPELAENQAAVVGRTTAGQAFEAGQVQSFTDAGVERKRWLSVRDDRVRPEHEALDGEEVGMNEAFSNGSDYPDEINCRCTVLPVIATTKAKAAPRVKTWRDERDEKMRADYPAMLAAHGAEVALSRLAERECLSYDHTRRIVRKGRRTG